MWLRSLIVMSLFFAGLRVSAQPPPPKHEFRGAWLVTLANLDWPSRQGLHSDTQKEEFIRIVDRMQKIGMNALIVQVRPAGDAFYPSKLVPWSQYLSGTQGQAPKPWYDPLKFMIEACHSRNIEFHAWFNPFRAVSSVKWSSIAPDHPVNRHPDWIFKYGESKYFDPGVPAARDYLVDVVMEVVDNYDVDGIHLDDYFYPYPINNRPIPDDKSFAKHRGEYNDLQEWRRNNVDQFVRALGDSIYVNKPWVKFGISPFGVWRNKGTDARGSETVRMLAAYDELYADTRKWLEYGWVDYMAPQLYWRSGGKNSRFDVLMDWWEDQGVDRHVYIGHAVYLIENQERYKWAGKPEFIKQARMCRNAGDICGSVWFRAKTFASNTDGIADALEDEFYAHPALVPPMPWLDSIPPNRPRLLSVNAVEGGVLISWQPPKPIEGQDDAVYYVVYRFDEDAHYDRTDPRNIIAIRRTRSFLDLSVEVGKSYVYIVTAVDRLHNESVRFVYGKFEHQP